MENDMPAPRGAEVWRDYVTEGVPSSGKNQPAKADARAWSTWLENLVTSGVLSSGPWFATKEAMTLGYAANTIAVVYDDPTAAENGLYTKVGASGSGSWTQITTFLPGYQFVTASPTGASSANAIVASTSPRLPAGNGVALVTLPVPHTNTAVAVTVAFDGGAALTIKTRSGENPATGELQEGDMLAGFVSGTTFRLITDPNSLIHAQRAEEAQAAAEAARDAAENSATRAEYDANFADQAKAAAEAAAAVSGDVVFYDNYADAAADADTQPAGQVVEVAIDETRNSERTRYRVDSSDLVFVVSLSGVPAKPPYVLKSAGVFDLLSYVRNVDIASAEAIEAFDIAGQDGDKVLAAVRAAGDDALAYVQAGAQRGGKILLPTGKVGLKDEFFSDGFQEAVWLNTNLGNRKRFSIAGEGSHVSQIAVRDDYISGCRNSLNGNERNYGPWANSPSPSILLPMICGAAGPVAFGGSGIHLQGTGRPGRDPIAWFEVGALGSFHSDVRAQDFGNSGHCVHGSYNADGVRLHFVSNGFQPTRCGKRLGEVPGIAPSWVVFDVNASAKTITAKAGVAVDGYAIGDPVPYFTADDVGAEVVIQAVLNMGVGDLQPLSTTIDDFTSSSIVSFVVPGGYAISNAVGTGLSFKPVRATTTADSEAVTLSNAVLWGRGARDMIGQLVTIPKAGSKVQTDRDLFVSRLVALSTGDDSDGYTTATLANKPRRSINEDFIVTAGHHTSMDETTMAFGGVHPISRMDDTNYSASRWENGATGSYQMVIGTCNSAVQYVACKWHGTTAGNQFAGEGQGVIDNARDLMLIGCDVTHMGVHGDGCLRLMGWSGNAKLTDFSAGGYRIDQNFKALYLDPMTSYSPDNWGVSETNLTVANTAFRRLNQSLLAGRAGLTGYDLITLMRDRKRRADRTRELLPTDDLNLVVLPGVYVWGSTAPANAPPFGARSSMVLTNYRGEISQEVFDRDNHTVWVRDYTSAWSKWRPIDVLLSATASEFSDAAHAINIENKTTNRMARRTTDRALMISDGGGATSTWSYYLPSGTVTPT